MPKIVMISGGFDPLHVGHIKLIKGAAVYGNLIVALNSDAWLIRKKGYFFMPWSERAEILKNICGVKEVIRVDDEDGTVVDALVRRCPDFFANGGDRVEPDSQEHLACEELGIKELFHIGGGKMQSSSALVNNLKGKT